MSLPKKARVTMKIKVTIILPDNLVDALKLEENLNTGEEVIAFLRGGFNTAYPEYAGYVCYEVVNESEGEG